MPQYTVRLSCYSHIPLFTRYSYVLRPISHSSDIPSTHLYSPLLQQYQSSQPLPSWSIMATLPCIYFSLPTFTFFSPFPSFPAAFLDLVCLSCRVCRVFDLTPTTLFIDPTYLSPFVPIPPATLCLQSNIAPATSCIPSGFFLQAYCVS